MVFLSLFRFGRNKGPDELWRKRKIFKMAAHFSGQNRNTYKAAIRCVQRAMQKSSWTRSHDVRIDHYRHLWRTRLEAGTSEHGFSILGLKQGLYRCNILLMPKVLADLSIWEPRTFKALVDIAKARNVQDGLNHVRNLEKPEHVITRGEIK